MKRYGNVNGFIYHARQHEAPRPDPSEPEPLPERQEEAAGESEVERGGEKTCSRCGKVLPLECFYRNRNGAFGRSAYCKACDCEIRRYNRELARRRKAKGAQHGR